MIELSSDGGGLGFGIVGGRSTGVVVKTILPAGPADKDGRLRTGDHLLQVGNINVHGMSSQQVATILRHQNAASIRIVVGRPAPAGVSPQSSESGGGVGSGGGGGVRERGAFTVATKIVADPLALEERLQAHWREEAEPLKEEESELPAASTSSASLAEAEAEAETETGQPRGDLDFLVSRSCLAGRRPERR